MSKKLTEMKVAEFIEVLASNAPAPGGGSASALMGAMGMGLGAMTTELTIGKKKYASVEEEMKTARDSALKIASAMTAGIDEDTEAFNHVMAALTLPKSTDEEKACRRAAIEKATEGAALEPLHLMERCRVGALVLETLTGKINTNCLSDLGVAALSLKAALHGAWLNVLINLGSLSDADFVDAAKKRGCEIIAEVDPILDEIYAKIMTRL